MTTIEEKYLQLMAKTEDLRANIEQSKTVLTTLYDHFIRLPMVNFDSVESIKHYEIGIEDFS